MPSANKTPKFGLNQWQGNEYPKLEDFNGDNAKIDAALNDRPAKQAGTWSPVIKSGTYVLGGFSWGKYYRVGELCFIECNMSISSWQGKANEECLRIEGLPFSASGSYFMCYVAHDMATFSASNKAKITGFMGTAMGNAVTITGYGADPESTLPWASNCMKNLQYITFSGVYRINGGVV